MAREKYLNMMVGLLEVAKMLYADEKSGFIGIAPWPGNSHIQLSEKEFRLFFGQYYEVDPHDPCKITAVYAGTEFIALTDKPER